MSGVPGRHWVEGLKSRNSIFNVFKSTSQNKSNKTLQIHQINFQILKIWSTFLKNLEDSRLFVQLAAIIRKQKSISLDSLILQLARQSILSDQQKNGIISKYQVILMIKWSIDYHNILVKGVCKNKPVMSHTPLKRGKISHLRLSPSATHSIPPKLNTPFLWRHSFLIFSYHATHLLHIKVPLYLFCILSYF